MIRASAPARAARDQHQEKSQSERCFISETPNSFCRLALLFECLCPLTRADAFAAISLDYFIVELPSTVVDLFSVVPSRNQCSVWWSVRTSLRVSAAAQCTLRSSASNVVVGFCSRSRRSGR
jgi:hypothetical protein